jgi:hypothetical protein
MLNEFLSNVKNSIQEGFSHIKEELGAGIEDVNKKIDENQEASMNKFEFLESQFGGQLAKISEEQKKAKRNKNGFTQVIFSSLNLY